MGNASLHSFISQPKRKACTLEQSCELTWGSPGINQIKSWKNWERGEVHILKLKFFLCWDFLHIPLCPSPANSSSGTMLFVAAVKQVLPETKDSLTKQQHTYGLNLYGKMICSVFYQKTGPQCRGSSSGCPHHCWGGLVASIQGRSKRWEALKCREWRKQES